MRHIFDSSGLSLRFEIGDKDLLDEYQKAVSAAELSAYKKLKQRHGIYASNQGKYVAELKDLNEWDSHVMEKRLQASAGLPA